MKKLSILLAVCIFLSIFSAPIVYADLPYVYGGGSYTFPDYSGNISLSDDTTVIINGNLDGAITASGINSTANIAGNVFSSEQVAVETYNNAVVTIGNDVNIGEGQIFTGVFESGEEWTEYHPSTAIFASDHSVVSVGGNINTSEKDVAINASNGSNVEVAGKIDGGFIEIKEASHVSAGSATIANVYINGNDSSLSLEGELNAGHIYVSGKNASVTSKGGNVSTASVSGENAVLTGISTIQATVTETALYTTNGGTAEIRGDVIGGEGGVANFGPYTYYARSKAIYANNNSSVSVGGDVSVGEGYIETETTQDGGIIYYYRTNTAVEARDNSYVSIKGNVTTGKVDNAIAAYYASVVNVEGEVNGGKIIVSDTTSRMAQDGTMSSIQVSGEGSQVTVGGGTISSAFVTGNGSSLSGVDNVNSDEGTAVSAWGNVTVEIKNDVTAHTKATPFTWDDGSEDLSYTPGTGISARDNAVVTVGGDVITDPEHSTAIYSYDSALVQVHGNVEGTISAAATHDYYIDDNGEWVAEETDETGGSIIVEGSVHAERDAVSAYDKANIEIHDGVKAGENAIRAYSGSRVSVDGDVEAGNTGIIAVNGSEIDVQGNVKSEKTGIEVIISNAEDKSSSIIVNGTVNGTEKAVELKVGEGINTENVIAALPQIIVQSLKSESDLIVVTAPNATEEEKKEITDALIGNINYIVDTSGIDQKTISVYGTEELDGYVVAKESSTITLKSVDDGYIVCQVEAGSYADIQANQDGSYTITVQRGGDLVLKASVTKKTESKNHWDNPWHGANGNIPWRPTWQDNWGIHETDYNWRWSGHEQNLWGWGQTEKYWHNTGANNQPDNNLANGLQPVSQAQGWDPAFVLSPNYSNMSLVINLLGRLEAFINRSDLIAFRNMGFETVNIVTEDESLFIAMAELLDIFGEAHQCMVSRNENTVQFMVMNTVVMTVTLVKKDKLAA